ncbi:hypothetical protein B0H16DRAFT_1602484 [Mycena metata]|uniref:Uncharacterized protein n=1 Tax=Mycena metata TaxID=1033252 RepID=A0AAD7HIQ6_9AGAR|nr:hypothetical protein B0H16DRAFT_1602484 [Mycena metata]
MEKRPSQWPPPTLFITGALRFTQYSLSLHILSSMSFTIRPSSKSIKSKGFRVQGQKGALKVNLATPFQLLLDVDSDSDPETPSPLSVCFDLQKPASSPLRTEWADSDDSDSSEEADFDSDHEDSQVIVIPFYSPFYTPPSAPDFKTTFDDLPSLPSASFESDSIAAQFHAELGHILPEQVQKDLFLIDEAALREMDDELFAAPMNAFIDVCLAQLRPPAPIPTQAQEESDDASASCPTYYLASYLDPQRYDDAVLPAAIRSLFHKRTLSAGLHVQASPAAARQITPFL